MAYADGITRLGPGGGPRSPVSFSAAAGTAVITGTATSDLTKTLVVSGAQTIISTLTNDTWAASGATFNAQRQAILNGLDSAQSETFGWNAEVRDKEVVGAVVRTSDTIVTITLTAAPTYDITANETITVTIPAAALVTSAIDITATPTFSVTFDAVVAVSGGWAFLGIYDRYKERKTEREKQEQETVKHIKELEGIDSEIAELLHIDEVRARQDLEIAELEQLVADSFRNKEIAAAKAYSEKVAKAYIRAVQQGNYSAYQALEREMDRAREEEDFLLLALAMLE